MTTGQDSSGVTSLSMAMTASVVAPAASARLAEAWMTAPSAEGSEKGMPSSMTSAPRASRSLSASAVVPRSGSPAVMYGMNAVCLCRAWQMETTLISEGCLPLQA